MSKKENIEDFKEVTEAEKTALEKSDAAWTAPPQSFIDRWNQVCKYKTGTFDFAIYGKYNEETGYFELNNLTDITYEQALIIDEASFASNTNYSANSIHYNKVRTFYPKNTNYDSGEDYSRLYAGCSNIETVQFKTYWRNSGARIFFNCSKLHTILGTIEIVKGTEWFYGCKALKNINLLIKVDVSLSDCGMLSYESLKYTVDNNQTVTTNPVTITVHPDVYAKLTDEENVEWHQLLLDAADKQIQFATI